MTAAEKKQVEEIAVELKELYLRLMSVVRQRRKYFDKLPRELAEGESGERAFYQWEELNAAKDNVEAAISFINGSIKWSETGCR